jgi:hypothetical protein
MGEIHHTPPCMPSLGESCGNCHRCSTTGPEATAAMKAEDVDAGLVEKAARAQYAADPYIHLDDGPIGWEWLDHPDRQELLRGARHALAAVLPEVQAQALRDAADELATCPGSCGDHRPATHRNDARTLRSRARRLTATTEEPAT